MKNSSWEQSYLGGGGYITGILQHPENSDILYARCDVAGIFKSSDGGKTWSAKNSGMKYAHEHSVQTFAINPHNPEVLLRCSGEARDNTIFGSVHRSTDGGESWTLVSADMDFYGNGPTRMMGETAVFHPSIKGIAFIGSYSNGLFISRDGGETWQCTGLVGERISKVYVCSSDPNKIYAASVGDDALLYSGNYTLEMYQDKKRGDRGKLFCSRDLGLTWECIYDGLDFSDIYFDNSNEDTAYAACIADGVYKTLDGGYTWGKASEGLPTNHIFKVISGKDGALYTSASIGRKYDELDAIPLYVSLDGANSWHMLPRHTDENISKYPKYMNLNKVGWAISKILSDSKDKSKLYISNWYGVSISEDKGINWCGNNFEGIETTCCESVVNDALSKRQYITMADHPPAFSVDGGKTYEHFTKAEDFSDSTCIALSKHKKDFALFGVKNRHKQNASCIVRTNDNGKSNEIVLRLNPWHTVHAIKEDCSKKGRFYAYIDGKTDKQAGVWVSHDWGENWEKANGEFWGNAQTLPVDKDWVEAEVLSVVVYQKKNVCGCSRLLEADPFESGKLYVGEWTNGVNMSDNCGENFVDITANLPVSKHSLLSVIKCNPTRKGVIYAGLVKEGLWRTDNYGTSWERIDCIQCDFNATDISINPNDSRQIAVVCEPLYWGQKSSIVLLSKDEGVTWQNISDERLGALRFKGVDFDDEGNLHFVTCGNGSYRYSDKDLGGKI